MKNSEKEAERWLRQAQNDLSFARLALRERYFSQVCFISQQAAEKALKALKYSDGARIVIGHSVLELIKDIKGKHAELSTFEEIGGRLDQYYIPTRYPNGLPDGVPFEVYGKSQAEEAISAAAEILEVVDIISKSP